MRSRTSIRKCSLRRFTRAIPGKVLAIAYKVPELCAHRIKSQQLRKMFRLGVLQVPRTVSTPKKDISQSIANFGYDEVWVSGFAPA
jgi:hypothetical protein